MSGFKRTAQSFVDGSKTLTRESFVSDRVFALEKEKIFENIWMCVGHISALKSPGDYFVREILGESLIILQDKTNEVRAFYNVCRHLGTRICMAESGKFGGSIRCDYHNWVYRLNGKLQSAPHMKGVNGFQPSENGLHSAPVHLWEGFIFVWLGKKRPKPFEKIYSSMINKLQGWDVANLVEVHRETALAKANWKLIVENFNECLHCPSVHPELNKHLSYVDAENDLDEGTGLGGFMKIEGGESMTLSGEMCALPLLELNEKTKGKGWYYSLFPTLLLNVHPEYLMFHTLFPVSAGETLIETVWLFNPLALGRPDFRPDEAVKIWDITNREDWKICERSQLGIASKKRVPGYYSPQQSLLAAFDREYLKWMEK